MAIRLSCAPERAYLEAHRPQLSYSPARNWMNDPNGLVYHDGEYHLFYQYNPNGDEWGDMSWGHAVSADLVHWSELPVALTVEKDALGAITQSFFSGSAVVDHANSSGLGENGQAPMVAVYTSVYPGAMTLANGTRVRQGQQSQSLAYSADRGRSWTQYAGNPVLALPPAAHHDEYREFRDPKVFWYAPHAKWVMVVVLAMQHKALWYASKDLIEWQFMSEFGPVSAIGGVWECPDLFELAVDGDAANRKWVLLINLNPGGPAGGSGAQYFIGQFDGQRFLADPAAPGNAARAGEPVVLTAQPGDKVHWLDYGADFYAAVSWNDAPDGRRVLIGWMSNWLYARQVPTAPWRSAQSVAREVTLRSIDGQVRLVQQPVAAFDQLRRDVLLAATGEPIADGVTALAPTGAGAIDIELLLDPGTALRAGVLVHTGANGDQTAIGYDRALGQVYVDRSRSGDASFSDIFAARHAAPVALRDGAIRLRILVDGASVTVFAGDGEAVLTSQIFPAAGSDGLGAFAEGGQATLRHLTAWPLASIWAGHE
ncbi:MAG: glycoside hydrolase family 32 protein [Pseudomonadota bacterium]|nr:glycoside hydrolase family 32 protein [Pseudomonadota bacterium]